ncbi:MAG: NUDIX domain-containing protein [Sulfuricaulis sp.]|uniref:NUDIX domain-containing protein n=1 Tax=Sulfuricaulis sp. TaxID=2003553 RepID=UPI0025CBFB62|nr:NUDIX domain-containing protein [Sulfuricaulis sp.]MCR4346293.1 NUDIX domain-containing protein [Sulfuricaulis sp.]
MNIKPTLSAGVVIVRHFDDQYRYLLLRIRDYWDFSKGMVEPGEDPLAAAIREVEEETTLIQLDFRWGHAFTETEPYGKNKIARYYVAESAEGEVFLPVTEELGKPEHEEFRWMEYDAAFGLLVPRVLAVLDWAGKII